MSERDPNTEAAVLARKAADDAAAMQLLASNQGISDEIIGFHAQQAVEKWLKAVLGSRGVEFEYTHDLHRLIAEVEIAVGEFPFDIPEVVALTEHAVPLRYDEILDTEPLDREATVGLVDGLSCRRGRTTRKMTLGLYAQVIASKTDHGGPGRRRLRVHSGNRTDLICHRP